MLVFPNPCYVCMPVHVWFILNVLLVFFEILHHLGLRIRCCFGDTFACPCNPGFCIFLVCKFVRNTLYTSFGKSELVGDPFEEHKDQLKQGVQEACYVN